MLPFLLYAITGGTTGVQVFRLVMWAVWGKAVHPLEHVSLLGSVVLIVVAVFSLWRPRPAAWVALIATLCMWSFYGPALYKSVGVAFTSRGFPLFVFLPPALLLVTTCYAIMAGPLRERLDRAPGWFFPEEASRGVKVAVEILLLIACLTVVASWFFVGVESTVTHEMRWTYGREKNARGQREIFLIYKEHPYYYERFFSEELARYLESLGRETVPVTFKVTSDFGKVRGYSIREVGQWTGRSKGWTSGGSACGGILPPCPPSGQPRPPSPWSS